MLINPPFRVRKRQKRNPRPTSAAPKPAVLTVMRVTLTPIESGIEAVLRFNTTEADPLDNVSAANPAKWTARYGGTRYVGIAMATLAYNDLFILLESAEEQAGTPLIAYAANPSDIADALDRALGAFEMGIV